MLGIVGLGGVWYYSNHEFNAVDWELGFNREAMRKKFVTGEGIATDTNIFETNAVGHPLSGMLYYWAFRTNRLNSLESILLSAAASGFWELSVEFQEKISLNDIIVTPVAGAAMGEVFLQMGEFFERSEGTKLNRALSILFSSPKRIHDWIDDSKTKKTRDLDAFGFTQDRFHEFQIEAVYGAMTLNRQVGRVATSPGERSQTAGIRLSTEIINIPQYLHEGRLSKWLTDGNYSAFELKQMAGDRGFDEFELMFKAALLGYYRQDFKPVQNGLGLNGYSFFVGLGTAYQYIIESRLSEDRNADHDRLSICNVLGPTMDFTYMTKSGVRVRAKLDIFGDFAAIRSLAFDRASLQQGEGAPALDVRSVLAERSYYYGFGTTINSSLEVEYKKLSAGARSAYHWWDSLEGFDRAEETHPTKEKLQDSLWDASVWTQVELPWQHFRVKFAFENKERRSRLDALETSAIEKKILGSLVFNF